MSVWRLGFAIAIACSLTGGASACAVADPNNDVVFHTADGAKIDTSGGDGFVVDDSSNEDSSHGDSTPTGDSSSDVAASDTGHASDSGGATDSGVVDGEHDTAPLDTGVADSGKPDTGTPDTGPPPTDAGGPTDLVFPKSTDTHVMVDDPYMWNKGDYVEGSRTTSLASATSFSGTFEITNSLSTFISVAKLNLDVYLNGTKIGSVTIKDTSGGSIPLSFSFAAIAGPTYDIKYLETNTVASGDGSITITYDVAHVTLK